MLRLGQNHRIGAPRLRDNQLGQTIQRIDRKFVQKRERLRIGVGLMAQVFDRADELFAEPIDFSKRSATHLSSVPGATRKNYPCPRGFGACA